MHTTHAFEVGIDIKYFIKKLKLHMHFKIMTC